MISICKTTRFDVSKRYLTSFVLRGESIFPVSSLIPVLSLQNLESQSWGLCHSRKVASNVRGYDKPIHRSGDRHLLFPDGIEVCGFASLSVFPDIYQEDSFAFFSRKE